MSARPVVRVRWYRCKNCIVTGFLEPDIGKRTQWQTLRSADDTMDDHDCPSCGLRAPRPYAKKVVR